MSQSKTPLLGLCPIGKFVFSHEDALRQKEILRGLLSHWGIPFVDLEGVLPDGMVRDQVHVDAVVAHFQAAGVDALFMPHCNFGTEGAVGMIGRRLGLPVLLWGPRDGAPLPDGTRLRDSLCGLFASSKVLHTLGVPFTYIENCRPADPQLRRGVEVFLGAAHAADALRRGCRIGHIGQRIDFFWTTIVNEAELLARFHVEVKPIDLVSFIDAARNRVAEGRADYEKEVAALRRDSLIEGFTDEGQLLNILAVRDQMLAHAENDGLDALAVQDFTSLVDAMGAYCFFANSLVSNRLPVSLESDIHGAVSNLLLHRAGLRSAPVFLSDITVRHPDDDNGVLLWHAGAPTELMAPGARLRLGKHWILPSPLSGMPHFPLRGGDITVARFDGRTGDYRLAVGQGSSCAGPDTQNNWVWMKVDDWPRWERILVEGPFIHHCAMGYGQHGASLLEACKYIPGLAPVSLNRDPLI
ncbi:MAG: fucose isomerase [Planctomycetes bacterium]|nr:fucose isomerase [Planctomycetota bacterium]